MGVGSPLNSLQARHCLLWQTYSWIGTVEHCYRFFFWATPWSDGFQPFYWNGPTSAFRLFAKLRAVTKAFVLNKWTFPYTYLYARKKH